MRVDFFFFFLLYTDLISDSSTIIFADEEKNLCLSWSVQFIMYEMVETYLLVYTAKLASFAELQGVRCGK